MAKNKQTRRKFLGHLISGALGLATGIYLEENAAAERDRQLKSAIEAEKIAKEKALEEKIKQNHPQDSLRDMPCEFGKIRGTQDILLPQAYDRVEINGKNAVLKNRLWYNQKNIDGDNKPEIIQWRSPLHAGNGTLSYMTHPGDGNWQEYTINIESQKSMKNAAIRLEMRKETPLYLKRIGDNDVSVLGRFEALTGFKLARSKQGVEEIVIRTLDDNKAGEDTLSICRAPLVVGEPDYKLYVDKFTPTELEIIELENKSIDIPLSVEITIPELGVTQVYHVRKRGSTAVKLPLDWPIFENVKPGRITADIQIRKSTDKDLLASFSRELLLIPNDKRLSVMDPYDSQANSAYQRWKRGPAKLEENTNKHWLYIVKDVQEEDELKLTLWETDMKIKIGSINAEQRAVDLHYGDKYSISYKDTIALRDKKDNNEIKPDQHELKLTADTTATFQIAKIQGSEKSHRKLDLYIVDRSKYTSNQMPK